MSNPTAVSSGDDVLAAWGNDVISRVVPIFATAAARATALPAPDHGQTAYRLDDSALEVWDGSAWIEVYSGSSVVIEDPAGSPYLRLLRGGVGRLTLSVGATGGIGASAQLAQETEAGVLGGILRVGADFAEITVPFAFPLGTEAKPAITWEGYPASGFWSVAGTIEASIAGAQKIRIGSNYFYLTDDVDNVRFQGAATFPTTGTAGNLYINPTTGVLAVNTSAARYKTDIGYDDGTLAGLELRPATYHHSGDDRNHIGFVADDLAHVDARAAVYNDDGAVVNFDSNAVIAILAAKVNRLTARVAALEGAG